MTSRAGLVYIGIVWLAGLATGLVVARLPGRLPAEIPYLAVPLGVGLIVDLALRAVVPADGIRVTPTDRMVGVVGGSVAALVLAEFSAG